MGKKIEDALKDKLELQTRLVTSYIEQLNDRKSVLVGKREVILYNIGSYANRMTDEREATYHHKMLNNIRDLQSELRILIGELEAINFAIRLSSILVIKE